MDIMFQDQHKGGQITRVPISSVVKFDLTSTLGSVKRKNEKRTISLVSNVLSGYTPTAVNADIAKYIAAFKKNRIM
ncbi:MAG: hypothetical protein WDM71_11325 [Ferruginibacter sp.]